MDQKKLQGPWRTKVLYHRLMLPNCFRRFSFACSVRGNMPKGTQQGRRRGVPPSLPVPITPCKLLQCLSQEIFYFITLIHGHRFLEGKLSAKRKPVRDVKVKLCPAVRPVRRHINECAPPHPPGII